MNKNVKRLIAYAVKGSQLKKNQNKKNNKGNK